MAGVILIFNKESYEAIRVKQRSGERKDWDITICGGSANIFCDNSKIEARLLDARVRPYHKTKYVRK